jgi:hypothetical protein
MLEDSQKKRVKNAREIGRSRRLLPAQYLDDFERTVSAAHPGQPV